MDSNIWAIGLSILGFLTMFGVFVKLFRDGLSKDKKIIGLEYEKEKEIARDEASKDSITTVFNRILERLKSRK